MIYLISRATGAYDGSYHIAEVLEGPPDIDVDSLWEQYEAAHEGQTDLELEQLAKVVGIKTPEGEYALSECFVELLIRSHGMKRVDYMEVVNAA